MKKMFIPCALVCFTLFLNIATAQTVSPVVFSGNGDYSASSNGSIEWTIGEPVSSTQTSATHITTMGFHQPSLELIDALAEENTGRFMVYPNPVRDLLKIDFTGLAAGHYDLFLTDASGKLIMHSEFDAGKSGRLTELRLPEIAAGTYFINVKSQSVNTTVKLNKVH